MRLANGISGEQARNSTAATIIFCIADFLPADARRIAKVAELPGVERLGCRRIIKFGGHEAIVSRCRLPEIPDSPQTGLETPRSSRYDVTDEFLIHAFFLMLLPILEKLYAN